MEVTKFEIGKVDKKINPGDYFIARKPKGVHERPYWVAEMDKFDGVIQRCNSVNEQGYISAEGAFPPWRYLSSWCEKVSPGDVMKTGGGIFIFKEVKGGKIFDYAYLNSFGYVIITDDEVCGKTSHATPEEAQMLFDALAKGGKRWNAEKMCIEDIFAPKELTESLANDGIEALNELNKLLAEFNEILPELRTGIMRDISYSLGKRDALKQVIKLCKKLLNE